MSATHHAHVAPLALSAALAIVSLAALASAFWFYLNDRDCVAFEWDETPVHFDEVLGLAGMMGCAVSALLHIAFFFAEVF